MKVKIVTEKGNINLKLFESAAPITVANFVNLIKKGYYNNITFHRVIEDFMAQSGDRTGTGMGGPGYRFQDEVNNGYLFNKAGYLAMANAGPNTNGSQFFITTVVTEWLNNKHTIFGEVLEESDLKIVKNLKSGDKLIEIILTEENNEFLTEMSDIIEQFNKVLNMEN